MNVRRGQNRPELSATGRHGTPHVDIDLGDAGLVVRRRADGRCVYLPER